MTFVRSGSHSHDFEAKKSTGASLDALTAREAMAVLHRLAEPNVPPHVDPHRAPQRADAALHAPSGLGHDPRQGQGAMSLSV